MILLWSLLALENGLLYGFDLLFGIAGLALGIFYGAIVARWILGEIDSKGEFRNTRELVIYVLFVILIIGPLIFYVIPLSGRPIVVRFSSFAYLLGLAVYTTRAFVFLSWERERGKHIATAGLWGIRVPPQNNQPEPRLAVWVLSIRLEPVSGFDAVPKNHTTVSLDTHP